MTKLFEISMQSKRNSNLVIKEGIKILPSLPITYKGLIGKKNRFNSRTIAVEHLYFNDQKLYFSGYEDINSNCNDILVHIPYYFSKTSGKIFAQGKYNIDIFVYMKDGDTLSIKIDPNKTYYYMAIADDYDIFLKRILIVD